MKNKHRSGVEMIPHNINHITSQVNINVNDFKNKTKIKSKDNYYSYMYGITEETYNHIFNKQNGKCAICGTHQIDLSVKLSVDHDHLTNEVRGLLCSKCNKGIGFMNDSVEILHNAINYLNQDHSEYNTRNWKTKNKKN